MNSRIDEAVCTSLLFERDKSLSSQNEHSRSLADGKYSSDWLTVILPLFFTLTSELHLHIRNLDMYLERWGNTDLQKKV